MAGYYHGAGSSEIQGEGLQTLYLMNPSYVSYTHDNQVGTALPPPAASPANIVFLSSAGNTIGQANLGHLHQQNPAYVGIPLQQDVNRLHYNLWTPADPSAIASQNSAAQLGLRLPASQQQGLSLSLSPHQPAYSAYGPGGEIPAPASAISPCAAGGDEARITGSTSSNSGVSNGGIAGLQGVLVGSKYLKATQELLDEVVNVGGSFVKGEKMKGRGEAPAKDGGDSVPPPPDNCGGEAGAGKRSGELSTAERQELQTKKAKLVNMLDEVELRYRQYHHQMQIVVAAFKAATGPGLERTYTALALQTISRRFRCLRDAIAGQIRVARRSLGEEVGASGGTGGSSRLSAVEQQLRQQRALQQLGMGQGANAWRPQRGLPERSVSVLRAWLFEHFLHPYPKDSDKLILAKQTGLTRSQVSNWFINARVRLWKPMVEEMYLEEMKDQELIGDAEGKAGKCTIDANEETSTKSTAVPASTSFPDDNMNNNVVQMNKLNDQAAMGQPSCFPLLGQTPDSPAVNFDGEDKEEEEPQMVQGSSKKVKNDLHEHFANTMPLLGSGLMELKPNISSDGIGDDDQFCRERRPAGYSLMGNAAGDIQGGGGFGVYQNYMDQFAPRFPGNGVSLTLGLPHCESGPSLAMAGAHQSFLSVQGMQMGGEENDFCDINDPASSPTTHSATAFENINIQNRKGFATQLLQDFVV